MTHQFLGFEVDLTKIQCIADPYLYDIWLKIPVLFFGERELKTLDIPLAQGIECDYHPADPGSKYTNNDWQDYYNMNGKLVGGDLPFSKSKAHDRLGPGVNGFIEAWRKYCNND